MQGQQLHQQLGQQPRLQPVETFTIIGAQVELPKGIAVIYGSLLVMVPGELNPISVGARQNHFSHVGDLDSVCNLETEHCLIEMNGLFEICHIDAVLVDTRLHIAVPLAFFSAHLIACRPLTFP